ncbi:NAD-dependent deacetylase [Desulfotomaculum nigrificans CO-1-SRB]|uniref:protein acetyllysine N-acetyltransferase n=1 Tax=Desulfotomaculum nigrificans (strain DSM 14880 / VKM B-2319 / CO-1-SRB) TaxID=868595 RepID=F6B2N0_DESCC|nr:NAD-dependent deacylase [Desulfotomaculum nigrificans]AEF93859.1 NAD-dependent deacetylase [Desulfotomaculum nigrificans CO-1-SRB]
MKENELSYQARVHHLVQLIKESGKTVALTGAGASTESGIPDFRSQDSGLWNQVDPQKSVSIRALKKDPQSFYRFNFQWWDVCLQAKPNACHHSLARLEEQGWLLGVITQNIDGLHQRAGSQRVWEVHGHLRSCHCLHCGRMFDLARLKVEYHCTCGGLLRPDVVLFGDAMPEDYYTAEQVLSGCQLLLVIGSSLQVQPVAGLPRLARRVVIINHDPTPWDESAELVFRESAGQVLADVVKQLGNNTGPYYTG